MEIRSSRYVYVPPILVKLNDDDYSSSSLQRLYDFNL